MPLKPFCRHDRPCARRAGPALGRAAAPGRRQHGHPRPRRRHRCSICRSRWRAALFSRRRHPRRPRRRRGLRHRDREPDDRRADASTWSRARNLPIPRFTTPGPVTRHLDGKGYEVTTGIGPDLMDGGARRRSCGMVDLLVGALRHEPGRRLHAVQRLRRPADQRDRRHAELGGVVLLPARRLRMTGRAAAAAVERHLSIGVQRRKGLRSASSRTSALRRRRAGETRRASSANPAAARA